MAHTQTTAPREGTGAAEHEAPRWTVGSVALLAGGMACFGSATPISAVVGRHLPVWMASFLRMLVGAVVLVVGLLIAGRRRRDAITRSLRGLSGADRVRIAVMATIGTFAFSALMILGMRLAPATLGSVVMATTPAVTAAGAVLFLHDRLSRWQVLAFGLAVAGVVVVQLFGTGSSSSGDAPLAGAALVFAAVCCEATYSLVGKRLTADLSPLAISVSVAVLATAVFSPFAVWDALHMSWGEATAGDWLAVLWWGGGTFALGSWLWFEGMKRTTPARASAFMAVMPVSALVLSYLLLGETFQWGQVAGMGLVLLGLVGVVRSGASVH